MNYNGGNISLEKVRERIKIAYYIIFIILIINIIALPFTFGLSIINIVIASIFVFLLKDYDKIPIS